MKLRVYSIVAAAVERAISDACSLAVSRWYKHRDDDGHRGFLESHSFQDHMSTTVETEVMSGLDEIIDFGAPGDALALETSPFSIVVYRGGNGWRWILRSASDPSLASSKYHREQSTAVLEATQLSLATGLPVEVSHLHPESAA